MAAQTGVSRAERERLAREREAKALQMRLDGASTGEIAAAFGCARVTAYQILQRAAGRRGLQLRQVYQLVPADDAGGEGDAA